MAVGRQTHLLKTQTVIRSTPKQTMTDVPLVLRTYIDGLKSHDVQKVGSAVSEDLAFILPDRTLNKTQFLAMLQALYAAFPDWHYDNSEPEIRQGEIAIKWRQAGRHTGTLAVSGLDAVPATGRSITIDEQFFFYRIRDNQIVEIRPDPVPGGAPQAIFDQIRQ